MQQMNEQETRYKSTLDLVFIKNMKKLDFMSCVFGNFYSDHSAVVIRYCKDGIIAADYNLSTFRCINHVRL